MGRPIRKRKTGSNPKIPALQPAVARWFSSAYADFSAIQKEALPHTLAGEHTLILAPTGSGKTLAGFLSVMSRLAESAFAGTLPNRVLAIYVSPLKALDNDIHRNLSPLLEAINEALPVGSRIRMDVRTSDTSDEDRDKRPWFGGRGSGPVGAAPTVEPSCAPAAQSSSRSWPHSPRR